MKFCINCGKEMIDTGKFCIYCGARQPDPIPEESTEKMRAPKAVQQAAETTREKSAEAGNDEEGIMRKGTLLQGLKRHRTLAAAAVAVIVALAVLAGVAGSRGAVIDLAKYTDVQFSGYNGAGTARVEFDDDAFYYDVASAMARKGVIRKSTVRGAAPDTIQSRMNDNWEDGAKIALAADGFDYETDRSQGLSNGDTVTVTYRYNNSEVSKFKIRFKGEDKQVTVNDLAEIEQFDAFAGASMSISGPDGYGELTINKTGTEEIYSQLQYIVDKDQNLRNGDRVTVTIVNRSGESDFSEIGRTYGKVPAETSKTFEIAGLTEVPTFDAFAGLAVTLEGVEPFGYISLQNLDDSNDIWFEADRYDGLSNGDTVRVRAIPGYTGAFNAEYAEIYGQVPETSEKLLQIQGLPTYVTSLSDIPTDTMTAMKREAQDRLNAYVASEWNSESDRMNSGTYKGVYLLTAKDDGISWNRNQLYLIYEVNATATDSEGSTEDITFYFYTRLQDLQKRSDGSCAVDLTQAEIPGAGFDTGFNGHYYKGYNSLDLLIGDVITSQADMYNSETDMAQQTEQPNG